jgi:hypothetical protein
MAIDTEELVNRLKKKIILLTKLRDDADAVLKRVTLGLMEPDRGKPIELVFPPKR